jgi:hypothetical protein
MTVIERGLLLSPAQPAPAARPGPLLSDLAHALPSASSPWAWLYHGLAGAAMEAAGSERTDRRVRCAWLWPTWRDAGAGRSTAAARAADLSLEPIGAHAGRRRAGPKPLPADRRPASARLAGAALIIARIAPRPALPTARFGPERRRYRRQPGAQALAPIREDG